MQVSNCGVTEPFEGSMVKNLPIFRPDPPVHSYARLLGPQALHLRLSAKCDAQCVFCERVSWQRGDKQPEIDMPLSIWNDVKAKFLDRVKGVELAGLGEPLLARAFPRVAKDVLESAKILYFPTNGHFLNTKIADCLGDGSNVRVSISFDAATPETYVSIGRGKNAEEFYRTIENVKAFKKRRPHAFLHSQFTAGTYNIDEFPAFIDLAHDMGIEEVQFRFVHAHTVAREKVSLRFAKSRTESAIADAINRAARHGITLNVERRPYSIENPNSADQPIDPMSMLNRYLDFAPFSSPACSGGSSSTACSCSSVGNTTLATSSCSSSLYASVTTTVAVDQYSCTQYRTITRSVTDVACGSIADLYVCPDGVTHTCVRATTVEHITGITSGSGVCPGSPFTTTNVLIPVTTYNTTIILSGSLGDCAPYFCAASEGGPEIVSTVEVPLTELQSGASAAQHQQEFAHADAAAIVWCDGSITSCFAEHPVGNVSKDDYDSLIHNPRYQAFLQRRQSGNVLSETWCANCPRVF